MTPTWQKGLSLALTALALGWAGAIGGGAPPDLSAMASRSERTVDNLETANRNLMRAAQNTEALAAIVAAVGGQLDASERLLQTQLQIEESSRSSARRSEELASRIENVGTKLKELRTDLAAVAGLARRAGGLTGDAADAADVLQGSLDRLRGRFDRLIEESRELNRKARGYAEAKDGPG